MTEYAADAIAVIGWLRQRDDVDGDHLAMLGYGDAGPVAMLAARREKHVKALGLIASPGRSGRDVTLDQQDRLLAQSNIPGGDRAGRIALQRRVLDAVLTGKGWEGISPEMRRQTDTPWFKSWLQFDPAPVIAKLPQPILIVHGTLDGETPTADAERLAAAARARKKLPSSASRVVVVPGVNHLLVHATSGRVDEYTTLPDRHVSTEVSGALVTWLRDVFTPR